MPAKTFRVIRSGALPGARNMALDEALAAADPPVPTLRLYGWDPWTLSLGYFQRAGGEDLAPFLRAGFGVTRRSTGGGAIFHAEELTYSVVLPAGDSRIPRATAASYDWLHGAVREALAAVGVPSEVRGGGEPAGGPDPFFCFARTAPVDLVARGRKIAGSAQRRTRTAFLQHGSIPLSPNGTAPGATSVAGERGSAPDPAALEEAMARAFARVLGAEAVPSAPTPEEEERAASAERERYGNPEWVLRPWRGRGRESAVRPRPAEAGGARPPEPLQVLRAEAAADGLRVLGAVGGTRPVLAHGRLRSADAATLRSVEERPVAGERDPWDSTFRRSHFADSRGPTGPEGRAPVRISVEGTEALLLLRYDAPPEVLRIDLRRFNYRDLGEERTGDPARDSRTFLRRLLSLAPGAAAGPGALALLRGSPPPGLSGEEVLRARAELLGGSG